MKALIVDNEAPVLTAMSALLAAHCPEVTAIDTAGGVAEGLEKIKTFQPDLLFTDVEMDDGTGMDMLSQMPAGRTQVVFITGHNQYAVDAFRFSAIDFLLKPVDPEELKEAVSRARQNIDQARQLQQLQNLKEHLDPQFTGEKRIVLRDQEHIHLVKVGDILCCDAEGVYTRFHLSGDRKVMVSRNLKEYEDLLEPHGFMRVHNSHLVNLKKIEGFNKAEGGFVVLEGNLQIPVSKRKKDALMEFFRQF